MSAEDCAAWVNYLAEQIIVVAEDELENNSPTIAVHDALAMVTDSPAREHLIAEAYRLMGFYERAIPSWLEQVESERNDA